MLLFGGLASCSLRAFKALGLDLIGKRAFWHWGALLEVSDGF